jgi:hypothetical protein
VNSCVPQTLPIVAPLPENIWPAAFQARENRVIYNFLLLISQKTLSASNCYTPPQKNRLLSKINYGQEKSERAFPLYRFSSLHGENGIEDG